MWKKKTLISTFLHLWFLPQHKSLASVVLSYHFRKRRDWGGPKKSIRGLLKRTDFALSFGTRKVWLKQVEDFSDFRRIQCKTINHIIWISIEPSPRPHAQRQLFFIENFPYILFPPIFCFSFSPTSLILDFSQLFYIIDLLSSKFVPWDLSRRRAFSPQNIKDAESGFTFEIFIQTKTPLWYLLDLSCENYSISLKLEATKYSTFCQSALALICILSKTSLIWRNN